MGTYTSFKLIAVIDKPYREFFSKLISSESESDFIKDTNCSKIYRYIHKLYSSGGFFGVKKMYSKDTGILVCGSSQKDYGHIIECEGSEFRFCIFNGILPFGQVLEYYDHEDDHCCDCICHPDDSPNSSYLFNKSKPFYTNKYNGIIEKILQKDPGKVTVHDNLKVLLKKDIESILLRYDDYNFDLTELKRSLENL